MTSTKGQSTHLPAIFLGSAAFVFLNFSLPIYADDLGASAVAIGGMYTVFTLTMLLVRPLIGWCLDHYGRRWFFTIAFIFYTLAMLMFSQSNDLVDFYIARFLQGIGSSLMWVSARTIVADLNDISRRGEEMGRLTTTSVRGSMIGAFYGFTLLGFMPFEQAWQWGFAGYAMLALGGLIWSIFKVRETRLPPQKTMTKLILSKSMKQLMVIVFLSSFATALIEPIYLIFLKHKFDLNVMGLAFAFFPAGLVYAIVPRHAGKLSDKYGRALIIASGVSLAGLVSGGLPWMPSIWFVALFYILFAVGWATASPAEDALVSDLADADQRGRVIGAKEAAAGVGAALGPLGGGYIYENVSQPATFAANGSLLLLTAALTLFWFGSRPTQNSTPENP